MKRDISLYIAEKLVDLDGKTAIQFTYTAEDLSNPTIVKNSFSKSIKIPGTAANNAIFGAAYRLDRRTVMPAATSRDRRSSVRTIETGASFNPLLRAPFVLYEGSKIIEQGYAKLDKIERDCDDVTYHVSLYGGLGSFFYSLSYDEEGEAKKLSSLDFLGNVDPSAELNFNITANAVREAWRTLSDANAVRSKWTVINFAPAYNGIPSGGDFAADKALIRPLIASLTSTASDSSGAEYTTVDGWSLVELSKEYTEWETKDLRSYLQRPVVSMRAIIEACCKPENNGGYEVELDPDFFSGWNPYYAQAWITLPLLNTYELEADSGKAVLSFDEEEYDPFSLTVSSNKDISQTTASIKVEIQPKTSTGVPLEPGTRLRLHRVHEFSEIVCQLIVYGLDGGILHRSKKVSFSGGAYSNEEGAEVLTGDFDVNENGVPVWNGPSAVFTVEGAQRVGSIHLQFDYNWGTTPQTLYILHGTDESIEANYEPVPIAGFAFQNLGSTAEYEGTGYIRSGTLVTKAMLLDTEKTPADYLLSYCKLFGLGFLLDKSERRIRIVSRNTLYTGETVDLQKRIDRSKKITINPVLADKKWYDFNVEQEESEYVKYYQDVYGREYGVQRVNTGYDFNSEHKDVLNGNVFKGTAEVLEREKYFINITRMQSHFPSVFVDSGHTYRLYRNGGADSIDLNVPTPSPSDTIEYMNPVYLTYDAFSKAQFHEEENEAIDSRDVLLFYRGIYTGDAYKDFILTDDRTEMTTLNDGEPCWLLNGGTTAPPLPMFGRYDSGGVISKSWDFGTPAEIDIPDVDVRPDSNLYAQWWRRYLADRYDVDTKSVTCYVNLEGMEPGESLLRKFYYFDGAICALNKISNYDLTSSATVQCEFVKVKDKANYTDGQDGFGHSLSIKPTSIEILNSGSEKVRITASGSWRVFHYDNSFTITPMNGPAGTTDVVISTEYATLYDRRYTFIFKSGDEEVELEVIHKSGSEEPTVKY